MTKIRNGKQVPVSDEADGELLPISSALPADVHALVTKVAREEERTFAAQLRVIVREWADHQPAETAPR